MRRAFALCLLGCATLAAQRLPAPTELPGQPFFIKKTWVIGGEGNWDYMALDPAHLQLFVAHGPVVQVVDVNAGAVSGEIRGLREAHAIALDDTGDYGYVSDGPAGEVKVFDRRLFEVVAALPAGPSPRALVFEPTAKLVLAVSAEPEPSNPSPGKPGPSRPGSARPGAVQAKPAGAGAAPDPEIKSRVAVIDAQTRRTLAFILLSGKLGFALADGDGAVYIDIVDRSQIVRLDAPSIRELLHRISGAAARGTGIHADEPVTLDWSSHSPLPQEARGHLHFFALGPECGEPRGLAVDSRHLRLFAACNGMKMQVLNTDSGALIASLPIGAGVDAIGYDPGRGLIYTANGGGDGSLTVIRQHVTDTYSVIQNLPTRQRARTLAVNPVSGEVYLVTALTGAKLNPKPGRNTPPGRGTIEMIPIEGSFQVLVIGN